MTPAKHQKGAFKLSGVAKGMREAALACLPITDKKLLITLISRIAEASFRRGFQHGVELPSRGQEIVDPVQLRFFTSSLDISPSTLRGHYWCSTSIARLYMEHHVLDALGLGEFVIWPDGYKKHVRSIRKLVHSKPESAKCEVRKART